MGRLRKLLAIIFKTTSHNMFFMLIVEHTCPTPQKANVVFDVVDHSETFIIFFLTHVCHKP